MLKKNLHIAIRNLTGNKLQTLINMVGLTTGLACFILIFTWINDEFSYDKSLTNKEHIFQLTITHPTNIKDANVPFILPVLLADEYSEISSFTRIVRLSNHMNCTISFEDNGNSKSFDEQHVYLVDSSFFSIFSFSITSGNNTTTLADNHSIAINEEIATKYFGNENPVGKILTLNKNENFTVAAVFKAPNKSHLNFDILLPIPTAYNNWNWSDPSYILLEKNISKDHFRDKIANFFNAHHPYDLKGNFVLDILPITQSYLGFGRMRYIYISSMVALFTLFIAGINYVNLSLANFTKRTKEMMVRNVMGAKRFQLVLQIIAEAVLLSLFSLLLAFIIVEMTLPQFNKIFERTLVMNYAESVWKIIAFVVLAICYGLLVGIYPAIFLSAKQLFNKYRSSARITRFRIYAVICQYAISIFLIICSIMVIKQLNYIQNKPLGIQTEHIIKIPLNRELALKFNAYKATLLQNSNIVKVSCSQALPFNEDYKTSNISWRGKSPDQNPIFRYSIATGGYPETFDMNIIEGRSFLEENTTDLNNFLINEEAVKVMGIENPIGEKISFWNQTGEIIGVVKDFHHVSLHRKILPQIMSINPANYQALRYILIKIAPEHLQQTIDYIRQSTLKFSPDSGFEFNFINKEIDQLYTHEVRLARIIILFASIALFISSLGILGMTAFLIEQRTKEISIRKINGASVTDIVYLLNKKILKWIAIATVFTGPIAYGISFLWLNNFAYKTSLSWWVLLISGGLAALVALVASCYETIGAALKNPVNSLRYE